MLKEDLATALDEHLSKNSSRLSNKSALKPYYDRTAGSPVKKEPKAETTATSDSAASLTAASIAASGSIFSQLPRRYARRMSMFNLVLAGGRKATLTTPRMRAGCERPASGPAGGFVLVYST